MSAPSVPAADRPSVLARAGWLAYQAGLLVLLVVAAPFLLLRRGGLGHYLRTLSGRTTLRLPPERTAPCLWIHAVSVGEVGVATTLIRSLPPDLPIVLTTVTPTGQRQARRAVGPDAKEPRATVAYLPFDFGPLVRRFHRRLRPAALVLVEGDYWPLLLADARRRGLPMAVVNGRSSDRAFGRQRRLGRINRLFYDAVARFGVQTRGDAQRLEGLGVDLERVEVTGNLKFDAPAPEPKPELERTLRAVAAGRPILVAGSTMEGEDAQVLDAFEVVCAASPALLVLAPRHPERWDQVAALLAERGACCVRRSALETDSDDSSSGDQAVDVVLLDSLGELARVYALASAAFIGGTLVPTGGHNPLEPAQFSVPTAVGPSMHNFREMAEIFDREGAWARVADAEALGQTWRRWLDDPAAARDVGARARRLLDDNRGATERSVAMLAPLLAAAFPDIEGARS